jgi:toxin-antitoxin system PIN domain toxin
MAALLDVNVLVALLHARHRHSLEAVHWLDGQSEDGSLLICRVAQMGALRILTQPVVMKEDVLSAEEFWDGWERLMADGRFSPAPEPDDLEDVWRDVTRLLPKGQCAGTDTYFVALARAGDWTLVTFDRGLHNFPNVRTARPA